MNFIRQLSSGQTAGLLLEEKEYTDDFYWEFYQIMRSDDHVCVFISLNGKIQIHLCWAKSVFCIIYQSDDKRYSERNPSQCQYLEKKKHDASEVNVQKTKKILNLHLNKTLNAYEFNLVATVSASFDFTEI